MPHDQSVRSNCPCHCGPSIARPSPRPLRIVHVNEQTLLLARKGPRILGIALRRRCEGGQAPRESGSAAEPPQCEVRWFGYGGTANCIVSVRKLQGVGTSVRLPRRTPRDAGESTKRCSTPRGKGLSKCMRNMSVHEAGWRARGRLWVVLPSRRHRPPRGGRGGLLGGGWRGWGSVWADEWEVFPARPITLVALLLAVFHVPVII